MHTHTSSCREAPPFTWLSLSAALLAVVCSASSSTVDLSSSWELRLCCRTCSSEHLSLVPSLWGLSLEEPFWSVGSLEEGACVDLAWSVGLAEADPGWCGSSSSCEEMQHVSCITIERIEAQARGTIKFTQKYPLQCYCICTSSSSSSISSIINSTVVVF